MPKKPSTKKKQSNTSPATGNNLFPYRKPKIRIPREISSAASLWLDFFQQFCELTVEFGQICKPITDSLAIDRAKELADSALETFQNRFPGVHP